MKLDSSQRAGRGHLWLALPLAIAMFGAAAAFGLNLRLPDISTSSVQGGGSLDTAGLTAGARPVLVELFTSAGCSSCPPADAYLETLSHRSDVLALSFHVDYWDGLGWPDRYSSPAATHRQTDYAAANHFSVYTPQMVIDGHFDAVGSDRGQVAHLIEQQAQVAALPSTISADAKGFHLQIAAPAPGNPLPAASLWLLTFDRSLIQSIGAGENSGRRITYTNVVRSIRRMDADARTGFDETTPRAADETGAEAALILQRRDGAVLAVASTLTPGT